MKTVVLVLSILLGLFMMNAGIQHFLNPAVFRPFVPSVFPFPAAIVLLSGVVEIGLGATAMVPSRRSVAGWGVLVLMVAFLPLHVWDIFRAEPAIGSHRAALVRLPVQFVFIAWAWVVARYSGPR